MLLKNLKVVPSKLLAVNLSDNWSIESSFKEKNSHILPELSAVDYVLFFYILRFVMFYDLVSGSVALV